MKIIFLTNIPSPYRVAFFQELGKNCELTVLYEKKTATDRDEKWQLELQEKSYEEIFMKQTISLSSSALCLCVTKYLRTIPYDIVIVGVYSTPTGMRAIEYLRHNKKTFVVNCDGGFIGNDNFVKSRIKKHFIGSATWWLSPSMLSDQYLEYYGAIKSKIFRYPFSSIKEADIQSTDVYSKKSDLKNKLNILEPKMVLAVGQFIHRKGFDVLIKAMKNLNPAIAVYIVGGEPTEEYLALQKALCLEHLYMIPFCDSEKLAEYYKAADVFVLPTREDIWGLVVNEAMAYGLPVITTKKCMAGLELVEQGENGILVEIDKVEPLKESIEAIINNEEIQRHMSESSIQKIRSFTIEQMAKTHIEIFSEILG